VLHLEHSFIQCRNFDASKSRSEIAGIFQNVVLDKDGQDQFDRSNEKSNSQGGKKHPTYNKTNED